MISRNRFQYYLLSACLFLSIGSKAQERDSIRLNEYDKVIYRDTSVIVQNDITIPYDSSIVKVKNRRLVRFYYNYMFTGPHENNVLLKAGTPIPYTGKIVGDIRIKKMEPFGTSIADTTKVLKDWLINAGNTVHVITKDRAILNNLLFEKGDELSRYYLEESERILRRLPFILDARVFGIPRKSFPDTVDVFVMTQDVFSININISPTNYNSVNVALEDVNMFGLGQRFYNNFILNTDQNFGWEGRYTVYNLYGSYLKGDISLAFTEDSLLLGISNDREFVSPEIRNVGGLGYHYRILRYYSRYDETRARTNVADNNIDGWYGRSFPVPTRDSAFLGHLNLVTSARISATWFSQRPFVSADTNLAFQHNTLLLGSVGISRSAFYKDILIARFGVIEDIPNGLLADATAGYSVGEFVSRPYAGTRVSHGTFGRPGYFFNSAELGSYFHNKRAEDGALRITSLYISKLFGRKKLFKGRVLLRTQYIRGINRTSETDQVDLKDVEALRGLESDLLFGNTALAGGVTLSVFSPWYLFGFRVGFFSVADLTYFSEHSRFIFSGRPYWGISSGIRLNNESFILGTIDFSIAIYPSPPAGSNVFSIGLALNPIFPFPDFSGKKPGIVTYGQTNKLYY